MFNLSFHLWFFQRQRRYPKSEQRNEFSIPPQKTFQPSYKNYCRFFFAQDIFYPFPPLVWFWCLHYLKSFCVTYTVFLGQKFYTLHLHEVGKIGNMGKWVGCRFLTRWVTPIGFFFQAPWGKNLPFLLKSYQPSFTSPLQKVTCPPYKITCPADKNTSLKWHRLREKSGT